MKYVTKRDGSKEPFDVEKINKILEREAIGLSGVSASDVAMQIDLQVTNNMKTSDIHRTVIRAAADSISLQRPNMQYYAARLALVQLEKEVHGGPVYPSLSEHIHKLVAAGVYDPEILEWYSVDELSELDRVIRHERNRQFTYAGLQQVIDKYLLRDRVSGKLYETPQFMYMGIALSLFHGYSKDTRLDFVRRYYDQTSKEDINLPTPIRCGVRTPLRQYASCCLIDIDDDMQSIFASDHAIGNYTAQRSGIGINAGRIRSIGSRIRHGEVEHTGAIPFLKKFEATVRCCTQNGVRGGNATVHYPFWHHEIEDIIVLKNNKGSDDNRVRRLDYSIQFCKLFYERALADEQITLFSPNEVPELMKAWGTEDFDEVYAKCEARVGIRKKSVSAYKLFEGVVSERIDTGRIYIMNIDHCNSHSSFLEQIVMSNLCQEITLVTKPIRHIDDTDGEIALCILSAVNVGNIKSVDDLEEICEMAVRGLDATIDFQGYPVAAAEKSAKARRSLGIGIINLAYYLAKHKVKYTDPEAVNLVDELGEALQYWCLRAGVKLAKEFGPCADFHKTKYSKGILPIDTYKKNIDGYVTRKLRYDWEALRADILKYGLRNSTYTAFMPSESSSVCSNATQGIDPVRELMTVKKSKQGLLRQIVPDYAKYGKYYQTAWDMGDNYGYLRVCAALLKYADQSASVNQWFVFSNYHNNQLPIEDVMREIIYAYSLGIKNLYYLNTDDGAGDSGCDSGACSI